MTTYREWLENQTRIYNAMRERGRMATDFVPDEVVTRQLSGYLVAYVFPRAVEYEIAAIAEWYGECLPILGFGPGSVHSTVLDFGVQEGGIDFSSDESQEIFRLLAESVRRGIAEANGPGAAILYDEILHRETTVVARGVPNAALWNLSDAIYTHCRRVLEVRRGWGAHITVARVTELKTLAEPLGDLPRALGEFRPEAVVVGTLDMREKTLRHYARFALDASDAAH